MLGFNPSYHPGSLESMEEGDTFCVWGGASVAPASMMVAPFCTKEGCANLASLEGPGVHVVEPTSSRTSI